jgi:DNA repair exonuclease SbcCD ATPase subunit
MESLQSIIAELLHRIATLEQTVATLQDENRQLREQLAQQERSHARQAAPFRRRESKKVSEGEKKPLCSTPIYRQGILAIL